jgi:predicted ferric reductase
VFYASLHLYGESRDWIKYNQAATTFANMRIQVGFMAWLSLALIFITSLGIVRRRQFKVFYYAHALFIAFIIRAFIHADHAPQFLLPGLCLWVVDPIVRFIQNFRSLQVTSIISYPGDVAKFKVRGFKTSSPGQIAWVQISEVFFLNWHPFAVASAPHDEEATFLIKNHARYERCFSHHPASGSNRRTAF